MKQTAEIIEMDAERDRKICVSLDLKVIGANRELAQWLIEHSYSNREVAGWLGCDHSRVQRLRKWAKGGFVGTAFDSFNKPDHRDPSHGHRQSGAARHQEALNSQENFEDDNPERETGLDDEAEVEDPERVIKSLLIDLDRHATAARTYNKVFKVSSFDAGMKKQISEAIDKLISKWRLTQATLARKERSV
jgi:hypothetical protein